MTYKNTPLIQGKCTRQAIRVLPPFFLSNCCHFAYFTLVIIIKMELYKDKISDFWSWFEENETRIKECIENDIISEKEFVNEKLNDFILSIGLFTWEIGINEKGSWFLTISPNGNKDLLQLSRKIIRGAPANNTWLFHSGKPAKNWDRIIRVYDNKLDQTHIDSSEWYFYSFARNDGIIELIIEAENSGHLDEDTAHSAADYFVNNELGEAKRIELFAPIKIVSELEPAYAENKQPISNFKNHIEAMLL